MAMGKDDKEVQKYNVLYENDWDVEETEVMLQ